MKRILVLFMFFSVCFVNGALADGDESTNYNEQEIVVIGGNRKLINEIYKNVLINFEAQNGIAIDFLPTDDPGLTWKDLESGRIDIAVSMASFNDWRQHAVGYRDNPAEQDYIISLNYRKLGESGFMYKNNSEKVPFIDLVYQVTCNEGNKYNIKCQDS